MNVDEASEEELWAAASDTEGIDRAEILHALGGRLFRRGAYEEAAAAADTAAGLFSEQDMPRDEAHSRFGFAAATQRLGRFQDALAGFDRAAALFRAAGDETDIATCEERAGEVLEALGEDDEALGRRRAAVDLFLSAGETERAAEVSLASGELLGRLGRQADALEVFLAARQWFRDAGNALAVAHTDDRVAAALIELGRLTEAIERLRSVLHVQSATGERRRIAYARYRLGWTLTIADEHDEALDHLEKARADYVDLEDTLGVARCDLQGANALSNLGRLETAIGLYRQARAVFDAHGNDADMLIADVNLAIAYDRSGLTSEAAAINQRVLEAARSLGDDYIEATVTTRLARNLLDMGRLDEAAALLEDKSTQLIGRDNVMEGSRLDVIRALVLQRRGDLAGAGSVARELVARLANTSLLSELAEAHAVLSEVALAAGETDLGDRHRAQAVALHLAAGEEREATDLSRHFLPEIRPSRWEVFPAPVAPADLPQREEADGVDRPPH